MKKLLSLMLVLVLVLTVFVGCKSEQEKLEEGIQGDWYASFLGESYVRFNYDHGEWATYLKYEGKETKMSWGTYEIKDKKIVEEVEDVADIDGIKPSDNSEPKKIDYEDGEVKKIYTDSLTLTREKP